jgi:hypothetical protein
MGFLFQSKMTKLIWTISILLLGLVAAARGQETSSGGLSDVDKTAIIEAVLKLESSNQISIPSFGRFTAVSSENIEFIEPSRLSNHGFSYIPATDIMVLKRDRVVEYLRFNQILLRDGVAVVKMSRVTEGRACFEEAFSSEKRYTYEARQTVAGWIAELTQRPAPPFSLPRPSFLRKVAQR